MPSQLTPARLPASVSHVNLVGTASTPGGPMTTTTYTQEPDAELVGWMSDLRQQSALDAALAKAMADYRAQAVTDNFVEVEITWSTRCGVCDHPLDPGDVAWEDKRDEGKGPKLCTMCCADEKDAAKGILR